MCCAPAGPARVLGFTAKAPSTLGTFLRSFRWGHVRQLDRVSRELLARAWQAGAGPGDAPFTIDLDSTICETYGLAKEGARHHGYSGARGYHPLLAVAKAGGGGYQRHHIVAGVGPAHCPGQGPSGTIQAGRDAGPRCPEGAGRHGPPGGDRRRQCGCGQACCVVASTGCSLFLGGFVFQEPLSQIQRSTLLPLAALIFSVDWGYRSSPCTFHQAARSIRR